MAFPAGPERDLHDPGQHRLGQRSLSLGEDDQAADPPQAGPDPPTRTGTPQIDQATYIGAASDLTYNADLAALGDQMVLSDGSKGYQQQQVTVQAAVPLNATVARIWVEAYQDSGLPLACRWDGASTPKTATRPPVVGLLAPSIMIGKLAPF